MLRAPSLSVDPEEDILYLSIELKQIAYVRVLYPGFLRNARYIAMDQHLACQFIYEVLPYLKLSDESKPLENLKELFIVSDTDGLSKDGIRCQGALEFEQGPLAPTAEDIKKLGGGH
jgi:hypothetical protein